MQNTLHAPDLVDQATVTTSTLALGTHIARRPRSATAHLAIARVLLLAVATQVFLAGLGVFSVTSFLPHIIFGTAVIIASLSLPIIAWRGHLSRSLALRSWGLVGLMIGQGVLIDIGRIYPVVAAFHPVNAMAITLVTFSLAFPRR